MSILDSYYGYYNKLPRRIESETDNGNHTRIKKMFPWWGGGGVEGIKGYYIKFTWDWGVQGIFSILLQCKYKKFEFSRGPPPMENSNVPPFSRSAHALLFGPVNLSSICRLSCLWCIRYNIGMGSLICVPLPAVALSCIFSTKGISAWTAQTLPAGSTCTWRYVWNYLSSLQGNL